MLPSILIVDDEIEVLNALERLLRRQYRVTTFSDPIPALAFFKESPTHIVLSDMKMPHMNGAEFLEAVSTLNESTKRVALTGFADITLAQQAINKGHVSFYLNKPWDNTELIQKLGQLVTELKQQRLKKKQIKKLSLDKKQLLHESQTNLLMANMLVEEKNDVLKDLVQLKGINNELLMLNANMVALYSDDIIGHSLRVAQQSKVVGKHLGLSEIECLNIYLAGLFHRVGFPKLKDGETSWLSMSTQQQVEYYSLAQTSAEIMSSVTLLKASVPIVKHLFERCDGKGVPDRLSKHQIPLGSRILRATIQFDRIIHGIESEQVVMPQEAFQIIKKFCGSVLDNAVVNKLSEVVETVPTECEVIVAVRYLSPSMELAHDVLDRDGHKLLAEDTVLSNQMIESLMNYETQSAEKLLVYIKPLDDKNNEKT
jgi:response regulator RpfG family c-di-GMP phosphodiesterase